MIDLLLAVVLIGYAVSGYRQGAVVGLFSLAGFVGGGALAMWGLPRVLGHGGIGQADLRRVVLLVVGVLLAAAVGQALMVAVGLRLRTRVRGRPLRAVDSSLGAVASLVAVSLLVSLVAGAVRGGPSPSLSRAVGQSRLVGVIDVLMPSSTSRVFAGFRNLLDAGGFPKVFEGFGPESIRAVDRPDTSAVGAVGVRAAARGVVKVTGVATCGRTQEGSGWVLRRGLVVTNAHVVAGVTAPQVQDPGSPTEHPGRVVVFDPVSDLAVVAVDGLAAPALRRGVDLERGATAIVAGYPLDGPYQLDAARVREVITARGEDIYGSRRSVRQVYSLYAHVQPGNSGGPLLDREGRVVGVVFAKSLDDDATGYALTLAQAAPVLTAAQTATRTVPTHGCAAG